MGAIMRSLKAVIRPQLLAVVCAFGLLACGARTTSPAGALPPDAKVLDLSYSFDESTTYWPTAKPFQHEKVAFGKTEGGYWYSSFNFAASEHGGTHMDAPIHFAEGKEPVDQIPVGRFVGPGVKISVAEQVSRDRDYRVTAADIRAWESRQGAIPRGAIVLIHTGWGRFWNNRAQYLGSDKPGDVSNLHFPGIGQDAAELLARERQIAMIGIDTASMDYGPSKDFIVHQVLLGASIPGIENVANMDALPEKGFTVIALPMKIAGGSGAPCRVIALVVSK
jgi:kynurenine formamidase